MRLKGHFTDAEARAPLATALLIRIDNRLKATLQAQIYNGLRQAVLDGVLAPGTCVPSSRALADDLRVSRTTTVLAYEQLIAEGYLTARRGAGTFVTHELPDDLPRAPSAFRTATKHPSLSRRGVALASAPPPWTRLPGTSRAFRVGVPALDLFPTELWAQVAGRRLRRATIAQLDYGNAAGFLPLRQAIADHVQRSRGTRCTAADVVVVAGAQRGMELVCRLLLDVGDRVWMEDPGYSGARSALVAAGASMIAVPVDREGLRVEVGMRLAPRARLAYVTPSHQFPTCAQMSISRRLALLDWANRARAWVVEDDYDSEFRYGTRAIPCLHGLDMHGRVIYIGTFSKSFFPALRLGFVIAPSDVLERVVAARRASDPHPPTIDQLALADFMSAGHFERHVRRMRRAYTERLEALLDGAKRFCDGLLTVRPVTTGLHAVADVEEVDAGTLCTEAAERDIEVMPVSAYFAGGPEPVNGLVLGFASNRPDALLKGMEKLAEAGEAARRRQRPRAGFRSRARG